MRRIVFCLFALSAVGVGVDCGGDSGPALSADEFVKQANAICKERDTKVAQEAKDILASPNPTAAELTKFFVDHAIPNAREKLKELGNLRPPTKDKAKFKKMLTTGKKALEVAEEGFKQGTSTTLRQDSGSDAYKELNKEFDDLARDLKLTDCAPK